MAAPTNPCEREDSPCQLGAVHTWHFRDIVLCHLEFRLRRLSGSGAETPRGPGLTQRLMTVGDDSKLRPKADMHPAAAIDSVSSFRLAGCSQDPRLVAL